MTDTAQAPGAVLVTGAGRGIGREMALAFAATGAPVALGDVNLEGAQGVADEIHRAGGQALALRVDVTRAQDCAALVAAAVARFGRLDVGVCNAGISQVKPFMDLTGDDWDRMLGVNVKGAFFTMQACARQMLAQSAMGPGRPQGKLIALASVAGRYGAGPIASVLANYRASKAAVISLTQSAAITFAPKVTVNAMCPGLVDTDMWTMMDRDLGALQGLEPGQAFRSRVAAVPMARAQTPRDVANLALYLASEGADYMTGQSINIDGGLMLN